jgi:hypothetical protein
LPRSAETPRRCPPDDLRPPLFASTVRYGDDDNIEVWIGDVIDDGDYVWRKPVRDSQRILS